MYYQLQQTPVMSGLYDVVAPRLHMRVGWFSGVRHPVPIKTPIEVQLDDRFGTKLPDLFDTGIVLMRDTMVKAIRAAGVDNIDTYAAVLVDAKRKKRFDGYLAVQVIGRIAAADMKKSKAIDPKGIGHTVVQFENLVLDDKKIGDALMFRLHETVTTLLVHERVKKALEKLPLKYVTLAPAGERVRPALEDDDPEDAADDEG